MRSNLSAVVVVAFSLGAFLTACGTPDPPDRLSYPTASLDSGRVRLDFGPGSLATTNDRPWGGRAGVRYPGVLASDEGPVEVEVRGLDLSRIEYTGDMGWPPDETDSGAVIRVSLLGSSEISYRIWSSVADRAGPRDTGEGSREPADYRAYLFHGYNDEAGAYGVHNLRPERWGPAGSRGAYNTVDVRLRYENGIVAAWVRLHASHEWEDGGRGRGAACPWNVAVNNAIPATSDSVWTGECRVVEPGETGRPVGAWVPVAGGRWRVAQRPSSVQPGMSITNWQNASGPYRVSWQNVIVSGPLDERVPSSTGRGVLVPFGTGQGRVEPRGEWAEFSYRATGQGLGASASSLLHYSSAGFELVSEATQWVVITQDEVSFAGVARVNGESGYRYELRGAAAVGDKPETLSLEVWSPESSLRPYYLAFGALARGSIGIRRAPEG